MRDKKSDIALTALVAACLAVTAVATKWMLEPRVQVIKAHVSADCLYPELM